MTTTGQTNDSRAVQTMFSHAFSACFHSASVRRPPSASSQAPPRTEQKLTSWEESRTFYGTVHGRHKFRPDGEAERQGWGALARPAPTVVEVAATGERE